MTTKKSNAKRKKSDPTSDRAAQRTRSRSNSPTTLPSPSPSSSASSSSKTNSAQTQSINYKFSTYVPHQKRQYRKGLAFVASKTGDLKPTRLLADDITTNVAPSTPSSQLHVPSSSSLLPQSSSSSSYSQSAAALASSISSSSSSINTLPFGHAGSSIMNTNEHQPPLLALLPNFSEQGYLPIQQQQQVSSPPSQHHASPMILMNESLQALFSPPSTPNQSPTPTNINVTSLNACIPTVPESATDSSLFILAQQQPQIAPGVQLEQMLAHLRQNSSIANPQLQYHHLQQNLPSQSAPIPQIQTQQTPYVCLLREESLEELLEEGRNNHMTKKFFQNG